MRIIHIAESRIGLAGGMARIAWHWKAAFERRGHEFIHIGPDQVGTIRHARYFPAAAYRYYQRISKNDDIFLVHEPAAGRFVNRGGRAVLVSHGIERRGWEINKCSNGMHFPRPGFKTRLLYPLWRLRGCDYGLRHADGALLSNYDDRDYAIKYYGRPQGEIQVFKNGVNLPPTTPSLSASRVNNVLFIGTWIPRKGIYTMSEAADLLVKRGIKVSWVLAGTAATSRVVFEKWPKDLHASTEVIPQFSESKELELQQRCNIFVLPSFFEGQPLALLQAMAFGRCCITTSSCGQKDIVCHDENGLLFEPGNSAALAALIERGVCNFALQNKLGMGAYMSVKDRSWTMASDEVVDFVEQIHSRK